MAVAATVRLPAVASRCVVARRASKGRSVTILACHVAYKSRTAVLRWALPLAQWHLWCSRHHKSCRRSRPCFATG